LASFLPVVAVEPGIFLRKVENDMKNLCFLHGMDSAHPTFQSEQLSEKAIQTEKKGGEQNGLTEKVGERRRGPEYR
jgi:hypothetical protein